LSPRVVVSIATGTNRLASDMREWEVAARTRLANARFRRLLDYCVDALGESIRGTEELSQRLSSLREGIESRANEGGRCKDVERAGDEIATSLMLLHNRARPTTLILKDFQLCPNRPLKR
jgi:hypothetical protein